MKKRAYIYMNYANVVVLSFYLDIIKESLEQLGYECNSVKSLNNISKNDLVIFPMGKDAFEYYLKGYHNIILWQQGSTGAESFMRHHSRIRSFLLNFMDCFVMKKAKMIFFVSKYMKDYYETLSHVNFDEKAYIMPCFNEELDIELLENKDYSKKTFAYVGSLDLWQCFEETVEIYSEIEKQFPNAFLKVLTFKTEKAKRILEEKNIKNYSVACVPKDHVRQELKDISYGFIIRHDIDVNRVATPTKISSYLSSGVLPIYSSCLRDFHSQAEGKMFAFALDSVEDAKNSLYFLNNNIDKVIVQKEIINLFDTYYSSKYHVKKIIALGKELL